MIKILGLLKSFAFLMQCILGGFFKNGQPKPKKDYFSYIGCQKNENPHILVQKIRFMDLIKLKQSFFGSVYPFLNKASQNALHRKGKTFQETHYFDHVHISHFFHQNVWIFIFWTPCIAKIAFICLCLSIFKERLPKFSTSQRQTFK